MAPANVSPFKAWDLFNWAAKFGWFMKETCTEKLRNCSWLAPASVDALICFPGLKNLFKNLKKYHPCAPFHAMFKLSRLFSESKFVSSVQCKVEACSWSVHILCKGIFRESIILFFRNSGAKPLQSEVG